MRCSPSLRGLCVVLPMMDMERPVTRAARRRGRRRKIDSGRLRAQLLRRSTHYRIPASINRLHKICVIRDSHLLEAGQALYEIRRIVAQNLKCRSRVRKVKRGLRSDQCNSTLDGTRFCPGMKHETRAHPPTDVVFIGVTHRIEHYCPMISRLVKTKRRESERQCLRDIKILLALNPVHQVRRCWCILSLYSDRRSSAFRARYRRQRTTINRIPHGTSPLDLRVWCGSLCMQAAVYLYVIAATLWQSN